MYIYIYMQYMHVLYEHIYIYICTHPEQVPSILEAHVHMYINMYLLYFFHLGMRSEILSFEHMILCTPRLGGVGPWKSPPERRHWMLGAMMNRVVVMMMMVAHDDTWRCLMMHDDAWWYMTMHDAWWYTRMHDAWWWEWQFFSNTSSTLLVTFLTRMYINIIGTHTPCESPREPEFLPHRSRWF